MSGKICRWTARILGLAVVGFSLFWLLFALDNPFGNNRPTPWSLFLSLFMGIVGYLLSWRWERLGSLVLIIAAVLIAVTLIPRVSSPNTAGLPVALLLFSFPYAVLALLFFCASGKRE